MTEQPETTEEKAFALVMEKIKLLDEAMKRLRDAYLSLPHSELKRQDDDEKHR